MFELVGALSLIVIFAHYTIEYRNKLRYYGRETFYIVNGIYEIILAFVLFVFLYILSFTPISVALLLVGWSVVENGVDILLTHLLVPALALYAISLLLVRSGVRNRNPLVWSWRKIGEYYWKYIMLIYGAITKFGTYVTIERRAKVYREVKAPDDEDEDYITLYKRDDLADIERQSAGDSNE